jgi:DNA-binding response OmpR family regulator
MRNVSASIKQRKKILIVDDDPSICDAVSMILEESGYDVESMVNGEAIYTMKKDFPDLFLLDIWMSGIDGRDICKYLKKQDVTKNIPIIMISANKDTEKFAKEAGADDFLTKPFEMSNLVEKITKYVKE